MLVGFNYLDMNTAVRGVLVGFTALVEEDRDEEPRRGLSNGHPSS